MKKSIWIIIMHLNGHFCGIDLNDRRPSFFLLEIDSGYNGEIVKTTILKIFKMVQSREFFINLRNSKQPL